MFTSFDTVLATVSLSCIYPPPPAPFHVCRVRNNDMFSSFPESMTHAHDHYWIYGGESARPGNANHRGDKHWGGLTTWTKGKAAWSSRSQCPLHIPPSSPGNHHTLHFWCTVASRCKGLCVCLSLWHNATSLHLPTKLTLRGQTYVNTYAALTTSFYKIFEPGFRIQTSLRYH